MAKSNGMWIGSHASSTEKICPEIDLNWVNKIKLLGIIFEPKCLNTVEENIRVKKDSISRVINMWKNRHLTLAGKIVVVKTLLLPQITHVLSSLPDPDDAFIKDIKSDLFFAYMGLKKKPNQTNTIMSIVRRQWVRND